SWQASPVTATRCLATPKRCSPWLRRNRAWPPRSTTFLKVAKATPYRRPASSSRRRTALAFPSWSKEPIRELRTRTWPRRWPCWSKGRQSRPQSSRPRTVSRPTRTALSPSSSGCANESWKSSRDSGRWPGNAPPRRIPGARRFGIRRRARNRSAKANRKRVEARLMASEDTTATADDAPLIDLNEASIKKLIAKAKRRGYITVDELNEALPQDQMSTDQIEDVMSAISEMGVNVVESDEDAQEEDGENEAEDAQPDEDEGDADASGHVPEKKKKETTERTDDPVRMYLREMGAVELLSREG